MKRYKCFQLSFLVALLFAGYLCRAQPSAGVDSLLIRVLATDELLAPLIDSAIRNSPQVKRAGTSIEVAQTNLQMNRKAILNNVVVGTNYGYGTNIAASSNLMTGVTPVNSFSTIQRSNYNVGVALNLPLGQLLSRKNLVRSGKLQIDIAEAEKGFAVLTIQEEVIRLYQALKLSQRLLGVSGRNRQSAQINYAMAEKNFLQNQISIEQYAQIAERNSRAEQEYETNANAFQTNYMMLETFTGVNLLKLITQVK